MIRSLLRGSFTLTGSGVGGEILGTVRWDCGGGLCCDRPIHTHSPYRLALIEGKRNKAVNALSRTTFPEDECEAVPELLELGHLEQDCEGNVV